MDSGQIALHLAMAVAPNGKVQEAFSALYNQAIDDAYNDPVLVICSAILDGLKHGNWPSLEVKT